ncbi:MAG: cysteine peptidase family C39 domain-containing protein [Planctomycetota bacterium]|jgi:hypothetical protein
MKDHRKRISYSLILPFVFAGLLAFALHKRFGSSGGGAVIQESSGPFVSGIYLQTDPRWADDRIGGSGEKMSAVGCTVCCICMALEHCGFEVDPGHLNELLKANNGYTRRGWVKWYTLSKLTANKISIELPAKPSFDLIDSTLRDGHTVIAKIFIRQKIPHWVLIVEKDGDEYLIKDPLGNGKTLEKLSKYKSDIHSIRMLKNKSSGTETSTPVGLPRKSSEAVQEDQLAESDPFAGAVTHDKPTVVIQSRIDNGPWTTSSAIYPLKGRQITLKVRKLPDGRIRWYQIIPDTSKVYRNANFPWEQNPYRWVGLAMIDYNKNELVRFRDHWEIRPFNNKDDGEFRDGESSSSSPSWNEAANSRFYHEDVGSFWFQAEVENQGTIYRSHGIEDSDQKGLSLRVFRVSIRDGEGYLGYLTSFFNVPGLFGSVTYQSNNYIGVDCADVLMAAYGKWKQEPIKKNYNVAMLVGQCLKVEECDLTEGSPNKKLKWGQDIRLGDFIAVRYSGSRQYQHIGALFGDANKNGFLDGGDLVIHAGPQPLRYSYLKEGNFDGHVVILRP